MADDPRLTAIPRYSIDRFGDYWEDPDGPVVKYAELEALLASHARAVEGRLALPAWQPIESYQHPDGVSIANNILIATEGGLVGEAYYNPKLESWWWAGTMDGEYAESAIYSTVTHWMPLPPPPVAAQEPT